MTNHRRIASLAAAGALLAAMLGCSEDLGDASPTAPPSPPESSISETTESPTSSPSPTDSEVAAQAATEAVHEYFKVVDRLGQKPNRPLKALRTVAVSTQLSAQERLLRSQRSAGYRQTGDAQVVSLLVQSVNLDNSAPKAGRVPTVQVDVCWDVSAVDVLDDDGQSVVTAQRPDRGWTRYTVANYEWQRDPRGGWKVAGGEDLEKAPCGT